MVKESICHRTSIRCPLNKSWCTCNGRLPDFHETSKHSWKSVSTSKTLVVCKYNKNYCCTVKAIGVSSSYELPSWKRVWKNASCAMWLDLFIIFIIYSFEAICNWPEPGIFLPGLLRWTTKEHCGCCNLSVGVALNVRFTTNGMFAKNNSHIYVARTNNSRVILVSDLQQCLWTWWTVDCTSWW